MGQNRQGSFLEPDRYFGYSHRTSAPRKPLKILGDLAGANFLTTAPTLSDSVSLLPATNDWRRSRPLVIPNPVILAAKPCHSGYRSRSRGTPETAPALDVDDRPKSNGHRLSAPARSLRSDLSAIARSKLPTLDEAWLNARQPQWIDLA